MEHFDKEIVPGFHSVREKGLNLIDASQLHYINTNVGIGAGSAQTSRD